MANIEVKILPSTEEQIVECERLRYRAYGIKSIPDISLTDYHVSNLLDGTMISISLFLEGELVASSYVSNSLSSLYIEHLFVDAKYQETGLRLGRFLLNYIIENKSQIEEYFHTKFTICKLAPSSEKSASLYRKCGFHNTSSVLETMVKSI